MTDGQAARCRYRSVIRYGIDMSRSVPVSRLYGIARPVRRNVTSDLSLAKTLRFSTTIQTLSCSFSQIPFHKAPTGTDSDHGGEPDAAQELYESGRNSREGRLQTEPLPMRPSVEFWTTQNVRADGDREA